MKYILIVMQIYINIFFLGVIMKIYNNKIKHKISNSHSVHISLG